jgi:hypothetical protein
MAITVTNAVRTGHDWPVSSTRTQSFDAGTGFSDGLLLAWTGTFSTSGSQVVNGCTYNGDAMTALTAGTHISGWRWRLFYMVAPDTGTNNIVFTYGDGNAQWQIGAVMLTGVDQSTPIRGGTVVNAYATDTNPRFTVSSATNDLVVAFWKLYSGNRAITEGSGTTSLFTPSTLASIHVMTEAGATSTLIDCTYTTTEEWGGSAVSVVPTAASGISPAHRILLLNG